MSKGQQAYEERQARRLAIKDEEEKQQLLKAQIATQKLHNELAFTSNLEFIVTQVYRVLNGELVWTQVGSGQWAVMERR